MNCDNCGAPMMLVRDKEYFFCQYCGAFYFPALTAEGVRILDPLPNPLECPICTGQLYRAVINHYPALHCKKCKGSLMQQFTFGEVVQYLRSRARGPTDRPRLLAAEELMRQLRCPYCSQVMQTHPYGGPGNIVIDTCSNCYVIWLDYGEINQVVNAPGRDRDRPWFIEDLEEPLD